MSIQAPTQLPLETPGVPTGTRDQWLAAAAGVLRKAGRFAPDAELDDVPVALQRRSIDGLPIPALGSPAGVEHPSDRRRLGGPNRWDIRVPLADPDPHSAAGSALDDLEGGADSLWLIVGDGGTAITDLPAVLAPVLLDIAPVVLDATGSTSSVQAAKALASLLNQRGLTAAAGSSLGADPTARAVADQQSVDLTEVGQIAALANDLGIQGFVTSGLPAHEAGAGDAAELGYCLAAAVTVLRALQAGDLDIDLAFSLMSMRLAVTDDQFVGIAKLRAARQLWARLGQLSGGTDVQLQLHAVTSRMMMTRYDPWVNLMRGTIAGFAGGVGGAQAVTILPFDAAIGIPDELGRRTARNTSHLLLDEAHVLLTADPAGGSHAIEELTGTIAAAAWDEFGRIEAVGGIDGAIADGSLTHRWRSDADSRAGRIATRSQPITGVSEFPHFDETLPTRRARSTSWPASWSAPFEELRDHPTTTSVFVATLGSVAAHSVRSGFVGNALTAVGIGAAHAGATSDVAAVAAAFAESGTTVAIVAGSDAAYAGRDPGFTGDAADVVAALREAGATAVLIAGRPPADAKVDDSIAAGDDLLATAAALRDLLQEFQ